MQERAGHRVMSKCLRRCGDQECSDDHGQGEEGTAHSGPPTVIASALSVMTVRRVDPLRNRRPAMCESQLVGRSRRDGLVGVHGGDHILPGPGDPRPDGANRAVAQPRLPPRSSDRRPGWRRRPPAGPSGSARTRSAGRGPTRTRRPDRGSDRRRPWPASRLTAMRRGRRKAVRTWSAQVRRAIASSQIRALDRAANAGQRAHGPQVDVLGDVLGVARPDQVGRRSGGRGAGSPRRTRSPPPGRRHGRPTRAG